MSEEDADCVGGVAEDADIFVTEDNDASLKCSQGYFAEAILGMEILNEQFQQSSLDCVDYGNQMTDLSKGNSSASKDEEPEDDFPLLQFPVAVEFSDITSAANDGSACVSCISGINAPSTQTVTSAIERNKNLSLNLLTEQEEKRVAELLLEVEEDEEKFGSTPTVDEREAELDTLLIGLGYDIKEEDDDLADEETAKAGLSKKGDPVLAALKEEREFELHKDRVDRALRALMQEPLPSVIHISEDVEGEDVETSFIASLCGESKSSTRSMPITEDELRSLIETVQKELEEDGLELADHQSIRVLARNIMDDEATKKSNYSIV